MEWDPNEDKLLRCSAVCQLRMTCLLTGLRQRLQGTLSRVHCRHFAVVILLPTLLLLSLWS